MYLPHQLLIYSLIIRNILSTILPCMFPTTTNSYPWFYVSVCVVHGVKGSIESIGLQFWVQFALLFQIRFMVLHTKTFPRAVCVERSKKKRKQGAETEVGKGLSATDLNLDQIHYRTHTHTHTGGGFWFPGPETERENPSVRLWKRKTPNTTTTTTLYRKNKENSTPEIKK